MSSLDGIQGEVGEWHRNAWPDEHPLELALCAAEEIGELAEAIEESVLLRHLSTRLTRAFLKEAHGANDRRAHVDWSSKIQDEIGDVMIVLAAIADRRGWSLEDALQTRFAVVRERFPQAVGFGLETEG